MSKNTNNTICLQEEFEQKIRPDLKDISNTIEHLLLLSDYFVEKFIDWSRWWKEGNKITRIHQTRDKELIRIVEAVYVRGIETAQALGDILPKINSIKRCPRLKDYISEIKEMQKNWTPEDEKLLSRCEQIISARKSYNLDFSDVELMLRWHKEHLKILRDLDNDLAAIEKSERYKIEEQMQLRDQTGGNATAAKGWRIWTWVKRHPHSYGLIGGFIFLVLFLVLGLFKEQWRSWCWGTASFAFLVLILSLLGGRSR